MKCAFVGAGPASRRHAAPPAEEQPPAATQFDFRHSPQTRLQDGLSGDFDQLLEIANAVVCLDNFMKHIRQH